ncbi:hypothetical protein BDV59DRAFT_211074 [Aspergillus ambiguus]|uniref:uncharacterized protein n=1 Tax=Aspergillus ambiguus TaxID=176160 RepID=UPI003CCD6979
MLRESAEEERRLAEERQRQEAELRRQAEEREWQERERNRPTTFPEFIRHCHNLLWRHLRAETPSRSTTGKIPSPPGNTALYDCFRGPTVKLDKGKSTNLFAATCNPQEMRALDDDLYADRLAVKRISRPTKRLAIEDHVHDIIAELCKILDAREEFRLGNGVWFDNHANALDEDDEIEDRQTSSTNPSKSDQFCIHGVDGTTSTLLTTVEYKPSHKLSLASLREGLRPMDFWQEVVEPDIVPTEEPEKSRYNAARLVGSAIVQEFHVMIQEGLAYSYLTNGLVDVQLWVPHDDPSTLYYDLGDPSMYGVAGVGRPGAPITRIEKALCLCLMSFRTPLRDQPWRNAAENGLPKWHTSFDSERSQIPAAKLPQNPNLDYCQPKRPRTTSEYFPSSSTAGSPVTTGRRVPTRAASGCAPLSDQRLQEDSSDSEVDPAAYARRKRGFSQVTSSPPTERSARQTGRQANESGQSRPHVAQYCTQKCLLGLLQGGTFDPDCPNTKLHMLGRSEDRHPISAADLVKNLKAQLDQDLDHNCTPVGPCGPYGAPFKITCATFGYTVIGKGTTSRLWTEIAEVYHSVGHMALNKTIQRAISRSVKEIRSLGIFHYDLRPENILWNAELQRALIIDFHRCTLDHRPVHKRQDSKTTAVWH